MMTKSSAVAFGLLLAWAAPVQAQVTPPTPTSAVDIIVEAATLTPAFYRGRAEPVAGSQIKLIAVPANVTGNMTYSWRVNGRAVSSSASPSTTITGPIGSAPVVEVTVSQAGRVVAQASEAIGLSEPSVLFYEDNALRGRSPVAIGNNYTLIGNEAAIAAIPYFTNPDTALQGQWYIDGSPINLGTGWRTIILERPEEFRPRYAVELEVTSSSGLMSRIRRGFQLNMGI